MDSEIIERLARIETHLEALVGNGQPGKIKLLEDDVRALRDAHNQQLGVRYAISAFAGGVTGMIAHYLGFHR